MNELLVYDSGQCRLLGERRRPLYGYEEQGMLNCRLGVDGGQIVMKSE